MSIPVDLENDSDVVMQLAFNAAKDTIATLTARCEALERGRQDALEALAAAWDRRDELHVVTKSLDSQLINMAMRCEALTAERDSLLAEKQADKDSFDRALAQFSAGYTQALDDALKGKP